MKKTTRKVQHRRKRTGYTDYRKRLSLLMSGKPRLVVRKSTHNTIAQIVEYKPEGDIILLGVSTKELTKKGWKHSRSSIPAAYLLGLMVAQKAKEKKCTEAILDLGLQTSTKGSRLYAVLKGAIDGGLKIPHNKKVLPSQDRLLGKHIQNKDVSKEVEQLKSTIVKNEK